MILDGALLRSPNEVWFGVGTLDRLPDLVVRTGTDVFLCLDPGVAGSSLLRSVLTDLRRVTENITTWSEITPELPIDNVERTIEAARKRRPHVVVGIGGGSAIDMAKLVSVGLTHEGSLSELYGENRVPVLTTPTIAVPTTAGTGSEVTPVAVVTDGSIGTKIGISSPELIPAVAVVDPRLTLTAPATVTAHAGMDALAHAVEAHTAGQHEFPRKTPAPVFLGRQGYTRVFSTPAISMISTALTKAVSDPGDLAARSQMSWGSLLAGQAFAATGTHLGHALQYPVGAATHTSHGLGTGLLLPHVVAQTCSNESALSLALAFDLAPPESDASSVVAAHIHELSVRCGLPRSLRDIGVSERDLPRMAEDALKITRLTSNAPTRPTREVVLRILRSAWTGAIR